METEPPSFRPSQASDQRLEGDRSQTSEVLPRQGPEGERSKSRLEDSSFDNHGPGTQFSSAHGKQNNNTGNGYLISQSILKFYLTLDHLLDINRTLSAAIAASLFVNLCWGLVLMSSFVTYRYSVYVIDSLRPPSRSRSACYVFMSSFRISILLLSVGLCLSITFPYEVSSMIASLEATYNAPKISKAPTIIYDAGDDALIDIIAVRGLERNFYGETDCYTNSTSPSWLEKSVPNTPELLKSRVIMADNWLRWDSISARAGLPYHASELLRDIESTRKTDPERPVIFLAHGIGGLLLKKALAMGALQSSRVSPLTTGIIFLEVPHYGVDDRCAPFCLPCLALFRGSLSKILGVMRLDEGALLELHSEFYNELVYRYSIGNMVPYMRDVVGMGSGGKGRPVFDSGKKGFFGASSRSQQVYLSDSHRPLTQCKASEDQNLQVILNMLSEAFGHTTENFPSFKNVRHFIAQEWSKLFTGFSQGGEIPTPMLLASNLNMGPPWFILFTTLFGIFSSIVWTEKYVSKYRVRSQRPSFYAALNLHSVVLSSEICVVEFVEKQALDSYTNISAKFSISLMCTIARYMRDIIAKAAITGNWRVSDILVAVKILIWPWFIGDFLVSLLYVLGVPTVRTAIMLRNALMCLSAYLGIKTSVEIEEILTLDP